MDCDFVFMLMLRIRLLGGILLGCGRLGVGGVGGGGIGGIGGVRGLWLGNGRLIVLVFLLNL